MDSSIYEAMVRLSQPWVMRYPLIDWHGNNGSITGDEAAAARYTEVRLSKLSEEGLLLGIKKNSVEFMKNYDESLMEPTTLPSYFPNLLCNPNTGIGVAISSSWLTHNLGEVAEAIYTYMDGGEPELLAPDFPTGGLIINKSELPAIIKSGKGTVKIRGQFKISGNEIIFHEIPYDITLENVIESISDACEEKKVNGVIDIKDQSNKQGIKIVIECDKDASPAVVVNQLFKYTELQRNLYYNQVGLVGKVPTLLSLKDCCKIYVEHNTSCIKREAEFDKEKAEERLHIVDGLLIALEDVDNVIALIKKSPSAAAAKLSLEEKYKISDTQSKAILAMRLSSLANLEKMELLNEKKELEAKVEELTDIISNFKRQQEVLRERLSAIVKKYGDARRTELTDIKMTKIEELTANVAPQDVTLVVTEAGMIRRMPTSNFKVQKRGGFGKRNVKEAIKAVLNTNTTDFLLVFTNMGRVYKLLVDDVPEKDVSLSSLVKMLTGERMTVMYNLNQETEGKYIIFVTKNGMVKKSLLGEYGINTRGVGAMKLKDGDAVISTFIAEEEDDICIFARSGYGLRFSSKSVAATSKTALGVKGIRLREGDKVVAALPLNDAVERLGVFTESGYGSSFAPKDLIVMTRGVGGLKITDPTSTLASVIPLEDEDNIMIVTLNSTICISAKEIPLNSRGARGVVLIKGGERIIALAKM